MMEKISRRAFLKGAGTVAFAVAAAGALTACSDEGGASVPNMEFNPKKVYASILYKDQEMTQVHSTRVSMEFEVTNKSNTEVKISKDLFAMELDGKSVTTDAMASKIGNNLSAKDEIQVKPGETYKLAVIHNLEAKTQEEFKTWYENARKLKVTVKYGGQNKVFEGDITTGKVQ